MGKILPEETERNTRLIIDYNNKKDGEYIFTTLDLQKKYNISTPRIYQILKKNHIPTRKVRDIK